jgi:hypothetical protein
VEEEEYLDQKARMRLLKWNLTPTPLSSVGGSSAASSLGSTAISYGQSAPVMNFDFGGGATGPATFNGLAGPEVEAQEGVMPGELQQIFAPSTRSTNTKQFPGDLGRFIGRIEQFEYALVLRGEKGAGKSRLLYQLMNLFSSQGLSIANFTLEMSKDSSVSKKYKDTYVAPENKSRIKCADETPEGIETIRKVAEFFDVVVIDSWGKIKDNKGNTVKQEEFDRLRKDFPEVYFLVIFQSTVAGTSRGGSGAEYDGGAVLQVHKGGIAAFEKNRYATDDSMNLAYNVFEQKAVLLESVSIAA